MQRRLRILRKTVIVTLITLFAFLLSLCFAIQIPAVQTYIVQRITQSIQKQLPNAKVSVGAVHFAFFNKLVISDIYASDIHGDTLLYAKYATAGLSYFNLSKHRFSLSSVNLYDGVFNIYDGPQTNNINEVLNEMHRKQALPDTLEEKGPGLRLLVKDVALSNFRFTYRNLRNPSANPQPDVIDFKDLSLSKINVDIRNLNIRDDTVFFQIKYINFFEKSGYQLDKLSAESVYLCANQVMLKNLIIDDGHSFLTLNHYAMNFDNRRDFGEYPVKVRMDADIRNSAFSFGSINHYAKGFNVENLKVHLHGRVTGTVNRLSASLLSIVKDKGDTRILTSFKMNGLPDINKTGLSLQLQELSTNDNDLSEIVQAFIGHNYTVSTDKLIRRLGKIHFKGSFDGLYNDFVTHGEVETGIGAATVDMLFHKTSERSFTAEGDAHVRQFNIGKFLDLPLLGEVNSDAEAVLTFNPSEHEAINFKLTGEVSTLDFNRYAYSNIKINGQLSDRRFEGELKVNDPNLKMDFNGFIAYSQRSDTTIMRHNYKADIQYANLFALNFNTRDTVSELKTLLTANYRYNTSFDGGIGKIEATNTGYRDKDNVHNIGDISLTFAQNNSGYRTQLHAKFADIDYRGPLPLSDFIHDFRYASHLKLLPLLGDSAKHSVNRSSDYQLSLQIKDIDELSQLAMPGLRIENQTKAKLSLTPDNLLSINLESPKLALNQQNLYKVKMDIQGNNEQLSTKIDVNNALLVGLNIDNINTVINVAPNDIRTKIAYDNKSKPINKGQLLFNTSFTENEFQRFPVINIAVQASELMINDTIWRVAPAQITIDTSAINFDRIALSNHNQQVALQGTISAEKSDTLSLSLVNFNLSHLNPMSSKQGYAFQGMLSGKAQMTDVYNTPMFYVNADAQQVKLNNRPLDNITVRSRWDNESQILRLQAEIKEGSASKISLRGIYNPAKDSLNVSTQLTRFPVAHVEPLVRGVLSNVGGSLSGVIRIGGSLKAPLLYGNDVTLDDLRLTVDYLNTQYSLTTPIDISPTLIKIQNATISDAASGKGTLNGTFRHQGFRAIKYDMDISANNLLCMNTTIKNNELFYGKAYATGLVRINGNSDNIHFDITATTEPNTVCNIPLSKSAKAKESNILTFKEPNIDNNFGEPIRIVPQFKLGHRMTVDMNLTATPNADIQIIFDEKAGDIIKGKGNGNIRFSIDPSIDKFDLFGDYAIDQGNYLFTLQNIISKHFTMEQGSYISFNGDIDKTTLDITAVYRTKASLSNLLSDTSETANIRRNIDCRIHITGNLFSPDLSYKVEVQNLDVNTRAQVEAAMNSDEKMTRQFISLLTLGSFMPEDQSGISSINLSASASEILSNQLSNILTQLNIPLDLGFVYNTTANGNDALDIAVSTQLFNNRLIINGAFGNNIGNYNNTDFTSDIDIELKFDKQGRFRGKAFTHSADQFTNQIDNSQRSGVGFIFQEDFNSFNELFKRWFGRKKKAEAVVKKEDTEEKEEEEK
ncbi:MAG: translocation/assembly module TamB [Bacteroidales bacterium]|nr:translocation/assembly module TamB [Bacteroidales bacterium]MCL2133281.1 translocation/assembly module TamB [Bacteroidales bacterium]